jgi:hypothetical protein
MAMKHANKKKRRLELFEKDPHCHWCGREVVLVHQMRGGATLPNQATLEHLFDRLNPLRFDIRYAGERYVLACYECNWRRGLERQREEQGRGNPLAFDSDSIEREFYSR